ncbi:MAG: hypothetical protein GY940_31425 [bacterium]|nr:hypothetical protein [bacterium]
MKRVKLIVLIGAVVFSGLAIAGCGSNEARAYNNQLVRYQTRVITKMMGLRNTINRGDPVATSYKLQELQELLENTIAEVSGMPGFEGNTAMRDAMLDLLNFYKSLSENQFKEITEILRGRSSLTRTDSDYIQKLMEEITEEEMELDEEMSRVQQEFADKYNFRTKKNPLQKELEE